MRSENELQIKSLPILVELNDQSYNYPMKRIINQLVLLVASSILLVSCITFEENYYLKKDGSGSFEFKVDMSQLMDMMKAFEGMEQEGDEKVPETIDFNKEVEKLEAIKGITNVKVVEDEENGMFSMSFDFKDYEALNKAHHEALDSTGLDHDVLSKKGNTIFFKQITPGDLAKQADASEEDSLAAMMGAGMLSQFNYKINFTLEQEASEVSTGATNNYATSNKKSFQLNATVQEIVDEPGLMNAEITF